MTERYPYLNGEFRPTGVVSEIPAPFGGALVAKVHQAREEEIEEALAIAHAARGRLAAQSTGTRRSLLTRLANAISAHEGQLARIIALEAGKPVTQALGEVRRAVETFTQAAAAVMNPTGEILPIDLDAGSQGFECFSRRVPAGVIVGISPFNFPLNLGAHKVAPALAVGAPILWKPPPQAPSAALRVAELLKELGADPASVAVLPCSNAVAEKLATDRRVRVLSFTGSTRVGWHLLSMAKARVTLELGGNAGVIVCEDANVEHAADRCAVGGYSYAGQSCISVQRIYVHRRLLDAFLVRFTARVKALRCGDPLDEGVSVGPVIDEAAAVRIEAWIADAVARGATVIIGGGRKGTLLEPTLLTGVPDDAPLSREEVFGPVVIASPYDTFEEALARVNDSSFGLQASVFTQDLGRIRKAWQELEVGGVVVNEMPTFRSDAYPYGGAKGSGLGREGVRSAMEDFTEPRVLVLGR